MQTEPDLDRIDRKILSILQEDGRIANLKLAEAVALSSGVSRFMRGDLTARAVLRYPSAERFSCAVISVHCRRFSATCARKAAGSR